MSNLPKPHPSREKGTMRCVHRACRAATAVGTLFTVVACHSSQSSGQLPIDLLTEISRAERRAVKPVEEAVRVDFVDGDGGSRPSLLMEAPARVIFPVRMPERARFLSAARLLSPRTATSAVTIRLGLANDRGYYELVRIKIGSVMTPGDGWTPVDVDLSRYSGWQWSLFYRPARLVWRLILNADATPGGTVAWARPMITFRGQTTAQTAAP
jgi:hypothetical protein